MGRPRRKAHVAGARRPAPRVHTCRVGLRHGSHRHSMHESVSLAHHVASYCAGQEHMMPPVQWAELAHR